MRETRIVAVNCFGRESAENVDLCRRCATKSLVYSPNGNEDEEGGNWQKTNTLCRVKLLPKAVHLIELYQSKERATLFAPIAYSAYLVQPKALQLRAGISIPRSARWHWKQEYPLRASLRWWGIPPLQVHKSMPKSPTRRLQRIWISWSRKNEIEPRWRALLHEY